MLRMPTFEICSFCFSNSSIIFFLFFSSIPCRCPSALESAMTEPNLCSSGSVCSRSSSIFSSNRVTVNPATQLQTDKCRTCTRTACCFPVHCLSGADVLISRIIPFTFTVAHSVSMAEPKAGTPGTLLEKLVLHSPRPSSPSLRACHRARDLTAVFQAVAKEEAVHHYSNENTVSFII
jgi:hypothetical protein